MTATCAWFSISSSAEKKTLRPAAHSWIISSTSVSLFSSVSYQYTRSCRYKSQSLLLCYFYTRHSVVNLFSSLWIIGFCLVKPTLAHYWFHDVEFSCCPCKKGVSFMFRNFYIKGFSFCFPYTRWRRNQPAPFFLVIAPSFIFVLAVCALRWLWFLFFLLKAYYKS